MAKKCIVNRSPDGQIRFVGTPNPNQTDAVKLAISRNKGNPLSQTSKGEPSLLYNSYIELLGLSPEAAEKAVAEQFSDKFGRWFGRWWEPGNTDVSKVVDENGQPKIVWSGQKGQYFTGEYKGYSDTFEKDGMMRFDRTALFTYSKYDALSYATGWDMPDAKTFERVGKYITEPYHIEPVFLNIRNIQSVEKLNYDKVIPRFPEFESKKIDGLTGLSDAANGTVRELLSIRDSHQMRLIRPEINFQNETQGNIENQISIEKNTNPILTKYYGENFMNIKVNDNIVGSMIVEKIDGIDNVIRVINIQEGNRKKGYAKAAYLKYVLENGEILSGEFSNEEDPVNSFFSEDAKNLWDSLKKDYNVEVVKVYGYKRYKLSLKNNPQIDPSQIHREILQKITDVLLQKGLVSQVNLMTPQELRQVLEEMGLSEETMKQIEAWHGSPHLFDKFSTSAIGTGEGAQAFGWGLYFTDLKGIAENYAKTLSGRIERTKLRINGEIVTYPSPFPNEPDFEVNSVEELYELYEFYLNNLTDNYKKDKHTPAYKEHLNSSLDFIRSTIKKVEAIQLGNEEGTVDEFVPENAVRKLYNVSLHQGKTPEQYTWLEWDKPVGENIKEMLVNAFSKEKILKFPHIVGTDDLKYDVQGENGIFNIIDIDGNVVGNSYKNEDDAFMAKFRMEIMESQMTGEAIYQNLKRMFSLRDASLYLLQNGIDGVRYPAESISRGATSDTARGFNYVVFDENAVTIQEVVQFQNELDKAGLKPVPNGFYRPSTREIYLNSENPRILETTIHEFAHPFLQYLRDNKPAHYRAGVKLLETNSNEAQKYIDLVLRTQPSLRQGSKAFQEEVLAQIVGDNGAKLVGSTQSNSIGEWLKNLWGEISRILGITQRTPEEISKMTLREFSDSVLAEMLDTQSIKNSTLTLSVLEQPHFTQMRGSSISPQTISNAVKGKGVKEIERQIITSVLAIPEFQTKKINYDDFELAVKAQLMPLERIESDSYAEYGSEEISENYDSYTTMIYNSPLDHGITGHFGKDFSRLNEFPDINPDNVKVIENIDYDNDPSGIMWYSVVEEREQGYSTLSNNHVKPTEDEIQDLILKENARRRSDNKREALKPENKGLFGHTRVWKKDDVYNVAEVQSDVFQKEDIEYILSEHNPLSEQKFQDLEDLNKESRDYMMDFSEAGYSITSYPDNTKTIHRRTNVFGQELGNAEGVSVEKRDNEDSYFISFEGKTTNMYYASRAMAEERLKSLAEEEEYERNKNIIKDISEIPENLKEGYIFLTQLYKQKADEIKGREILNSQEKQFLASEKSFELRLIRESIRDAANQGFKKLRLPLPYTLSKIEGYLNERGQVHVEGEPEIGGQVKYFGIDHKIIYKSGGVIKIVDNRDVTEEPKRAYVKMLAYHDWINIRSEYFRDKRIYTIDEIKSRLEKSDLKEKTKNDIVNLLRGEVVHSNEVVIADHTDIIENVIFENISDTDIENSLQGPEKGYPTISITDDLILYTYSEGEWISYSGDSQKKESFKIEALNENHQPIARRYEYFGKLLEKERPDNLRIVDDENGYPWYETQILESDKNSPVLAFQAERSDQDRLIRTGLALGYNYDIDQVARERFEIPKLKRIGSGSDRVVYDLNDSYVLKVAKTARGLEQNYYEGDSYLVEEGILPQVIEKGLNYVVVEKVVPIKARDIVPTYDVEGDQIGTERADRMFAELSRFHQADFDRREQKLLDTLYKYGLYEVVNFEILIGDFSRKANWGIRDGRPIHLDGGTFAGESLLTNYAGKRNLDDPAFREIYQRSREAKKLYGDRDTNTMFQMEDRREKDLIKEKAIENGTWMKAPNGKPTNLNEYQYLEVRTERFKNWFGDWQNNPENASKIVDENGEPKIMYTGTSKDKDFKKFNVPRNGAWFTSDPNEASMYALDNDSKGVKYDSSGKYVDVNTASRVIPVFLNLRTIADFNREVTPEQREKLKYANNYKKIQGNLFQNIYFSRSLDENRFDGIDYTGDGKVMVVLMNPNTIKSAIANTGAYSLDNNDIRFQMSEVTQNQMIPSQLYEQLRQQPFVDSEQALEAYKNVYTDSVGDWQSTEFNC